ncbi:Pyridinium-3,5-bisthiocarboxylic acid mononucleotide nickel insertion protein [subsurface metagenome]
MKILYFDPILGASGDMILAALIDLGVPKDYLKKKLRFIPNFELKVARVQRHGASAQHMKFQIKGKIKENRFIPLINKSGLSSSIKATAITIVNRIFEVEKKVHRADHLHLHELADADTLLDITGALVAIDYLKVDKIYSKPLKAGKGFIKTVEGNMPAFNFATAELLKDFPVEFLPIPAELTTPTGAAIISTIAEPADNLILSKIISVGMGTGTLDIKDYPNLLRIFVGESDEKLHDECTIIKTNIDDMNPQDYDLVFEKLYEAGALEVFLTPIIMKHSRPGVLLTVLCQKNKNKIFDILFKETTTLGIRIENTKRLKLRRKIINVKTPYGNIKVKIAEIGNKTRFSLEYQDLKKIAQKNNLSLRELRNELTKFVEQKIFRQTPS